MAILEKRVPYSQRYLFNAIAITNHNANPANPNTRYRYEYGTRFSRIAAVIIIGVSLKQCELNRS